MEKINLEMWVYVVVVIMHFALVVWKVFMLLIKKNQMKILYIIFQKNIYDENINFDILLFNK